MLHTYSYLYVPLNYTQNKYSVIYTRSQGRDTALFGLRWGQALPGPGPFLMMPPAGSPADVGNLWNYSDPPGAGAKKNPVMLESTSRLLFETQGREGLNGIHPLRVGAALPPPPRGEGGPVGSEKGLEKNPAKVPGLWPD